VSDSISFGDVTSYGSASDPQPSSGGACSYGPTGITRYAAIQANHLPGDLRGQWNDGKICGQCALVRVRTDSGWKQTLVRIMDECPDSYCGIDLGGQPAKDLMGTQVGRYSGEWSLVSCKGHPELFDGPSRIWIKDGSSQWWAIVQVRDPLQAVQALRFRRVGAVDSSWTDMAWATEAYNFFKVPPDVLSDSTSTYELQVLYGDGSIQSATTLASALSKAKDSILLSPQP
jgi:expansin (peptidoglycan-binding protein)